LEFIVGIVVGLIASKPADGAMIHPAGIIMSIIGALILRYAWNHLAH